MCSHFNIEDGRKCTTFSAYYVFFKKCKNTTEMQEKTCAVYGEGAGTDQMVNSGLQSDQIETLLRSKLYNTGDSQYTQNIQVIGKNERYILFYRNN